MGDGRTFHRYGDVAAFSSRLWVLAVW